MTGKRGERSAGGSRSTARPIRREEEEFAELLAEKAAPAEGKGEPMNIRRRPVQLPPMERIKDTG